MFNSETRMHDSAHFRPCVLIPVYNHHQVLGQTLARIAALGLPVVLVDDGSEASSHAVLEELVAAHDGVQMVTHPHNRGKGGAIKTGLRAALRQGYSHALQIDADGQHNIDDVPRFLELARSVPGRLIAGRPVYDESVPKIRFYCRYLTHGLVWLNTLSLQVADSMCGFRVYPLRASCELLDAEPMGERMDFDIEFMVRWHWRRWPLIQIPTRVIYPENGISHFLMWRDNTLITWMHCRLFLGMLWRIPRIVWGKFNPPEAR
jgi:glycosyltransferase involved in cell wall biosynthesis